jgi:hypothetical protein
MRQLGHKDGNKRASPRRRCQASRHTVFSRSAGHIAVSCASAAAGPKHSPATGSKLFNPRSVRIFYSSLDLLGF